MFRISFGFRSVSEQGKTISEMCSDITEGLYHGENLKRIQNGLLYDSKNQNLNTGNYIYSVWASAFRREIVAPIQMKVPKTIKMGEDVAVTMPAVCHSKSIYFLNKIKYNYLIRNSSMSRTFSRYEMEETIRLIAHLKANADQIPVENLDGYLYRMAEDYWIKAARSLPNYGEFRDCVVQSLQIMPEGFMQYVSKFPLRFKYKLRFLVVKNNLWFLLWLFYHKG